MSNTALAPRSVLFVGRSALDQGILDQLCSYCQPDPHWVDAAPQAISALGDQAWNLCLIHLDPDPQAGFAAASLIIRNLTASGKPTPPCIGISSSGAGAMAGLSTTSGLDAILSFPCQADVWAQWFSDPVDFDSESLIERMMGNELLAKRVVGVFLEDAPRQLMDLHDALRRQDNESSSRIAHSLRGAASNVGGDSLASLSKGIEHASSLGQFAEVERMLPRLEEQFSRLRPVLERFCR